MVSIKHTGIYVKDLLLEKDFHTKVFDMRLLVDYQEDSSAIFDELFESLGNTIVVSKMISQTGEINHTGDMIELICMLNGGDTYADVHENICDIGRCHIAIGVDDIENVKEKIPQYGGKIMTQIHGKGNRRITFAINPEGNWLEIIE